MDKQIVTINFPSDILLALNENEQELKKDIKLSFAIRLYRMQKLTIGKAAQIAGMSRYDFETVLSDNEISISNLNFTDVMKDVEKLKKASPRREKLNPIIDLSY